MADIKKQIADIVNKIKKELESTVRSQKFYAELGTFTEEQIRKRTKLGYGVSESGKQEKLKPLADSTKKGKKYKQKAGKLSKETTPNRSNLTDTGQLLKSITNKPTTTKVTIEFKDQRNDDIGNKEVAKHVQDNGRRFFDLSTPETNALKRLIEKKIQEMVKRLK